MRLAEAVVNLLICFSVKFETEINNYQNRFTHVKVTTRQNSDIFSDAMYIVVCIEVGFDCWSLGSHQCNNAIGAVCQLSLEVAYECIAGVPV